MGSRMKYKINDTVEFKAGSLSYGKIVDYDISESLELRGAINAFRHAHEATAQRRDEKPTTIHHFDRFIL